MNPNLLTIETQDLEASIEFYTKTLDYQLDMRYRVGKPSEIAILRDERSILELVLSDHNQIDFEGSLHKRVKSIDDWLIGCKDKSLSIIKVERSSDRSFNIMTLKDKHGVTINLYEKRNH